MDDVQGSTLIGEPTKALLDYAKKVTESAYRMWEADVERPRDSGFADEAVLEATLIICLYNMMNRFVSALGVPADDFHNRRLLQKRGRVDASGASCVSLAHGQDCST